MDHGKVVTVPVPADEAWLWRTHLKWHLDSFCRSKDTTPETLLNEITDKKRQLWVGMRSKEPMVAVLSTVCDDLLKTFRITHAAGKEREAWIHLWKDLEDFAKSIGCKRIEAEARPGWEKVLKDMKKTHVILEKRL